MVKPAVRQGAGALLRSATTAAGRANIGPTPRGDLRPAPLPVQIEEVVGLLVGEAGGPPGARIDAALDENRAIRLEHRTNLRREQRDGARGDELMRLESPGARR